MTTPEQLADLRAGDLVELTHPNHPGFLIRGYVTLDSDGTSDLRLWLGESVLRNSSGDRGINFRGYDLALVERAKPPFYVNHTRTEPVSGDVCRDADNPSDPLVWYHKPSLGAITWWRLGGGGGGEPPASRRLLVDGSTGDVVLP